MKLRETISDKFLSLFGKSGFVYASAGRINLIGEHTDYNGGFVFPGAIDKVIIAEILPTRMMLHLSLGLATSLVYVAKFSNEEVL